VERAFLPISINNATQEEGWKLEHEDHAARYRLGLPV